MKKLDKEIVVGVFIFVGLLCMAYASFKLGRVDLFNKDYYPVKAIFSSVAGLREDTNVEIAGVKVGKVKDIYLEDYQAVVTILIKNGVKLQEDAIASVQTKGLLGEKYIQIIPGASEVTIEPNGVLFDTEPPFSLENMLKNLAVGEE